MFRKRNLLIIALILTAFSAVFAQTSPFDGKVELLKEDGTREPVAGASVKVYRTDIKSGGPSTKTNKKGEFQFVGFMLGAQYSIAISAPNCAPTMLSGLKAGMSGVPFTMKPGDGTALTEDEVRSGQSKVPGATINAGTGDSAGTKSDGGGGELTAEQKKAKADYDKKLAEYEAKKKDADNKFQGVNKALSEGNALMKEKNYAAAAAKFNEGYELDPEFIGSAPILLISRGNAQKAIGVDSYNAWVNEKDPAKKQGLSDTSKQALLDAYAAYSKAVSLIESAPPAEAAKINGIEITKKQAYGSLVEVHRLLVTTRADLTKTADMRAALDKYLTMETDPASKSKAWMQYGDAMLPTGEAAGAIEGYRKVLEIEPNNAKALNGLGLSLINGGYINNDKSQIQEGVNTLQQFIDAAGSAPEFANAKREAQETIDGIKSAEKIAPQKGGGRKKT